MRQGWIQKIGPDGKSYFVDKYQAEVTPRAPAILPDLPPYTSPVTGKVVDGRKQRREDLKRAGAVPYDPGMKQDAIKKREDDWKKLDRSVEDRLQWFKA